VIIIINGVPYIIPDSDGPPTPETRTDKIFSYIIIGLTVFITIAFLWLLFR
jgi:hypothetical protein